MHDVFTRYSWHKGRWAHRRESTDVVLRVFPRLSPNPDHDLHNLYCRTKVLLHHPFRDEVQFLQGADGSMRTWWEVFTSCKAHHLGHPRNTLRSIEDECGAVEDDDDEDEEIERPPGPDVEEEGWQVYARMHPTAPGPTYEAGNIGRRPLDSS